MQTLLVVLAAMLLNSGQAIATETTDVMATLHQFVDGFNKGDVKAALAACADQTSVIDDFAPHEWHGAGACGSWANDFDAYTRKSGITDSFVTLGKPRHVDITGDRAYVVVPANYTYKEKGNARKELGSTLTAALQKGQAGWRITGWAWAMR